MESLMKLHGYNKKEEQDNPNWPEVVNDFSDLISRNKLSTYLKWATSCLQGIYFNSKGFIENKNKFLLHNNLSGNNDEQIQNIRATFAQESSEEVISILSKISAEHSLLDENGQIWLPDNSVSNLTVLNKGIIGVDDFEYRMGGCFLNDSGRKRFYRAYEDRRHEMITHPLFGYRIPYLRIYELQARFLAKVLQGELAEYKPFVVR